MSAFGKLSRIIVTRRIESFRKKGREALYKGDKQKALELNEQANELAKNNFKPTDREYIISASRLAELRHTTGDKEGAKSLLLKIVDNAGKVLGETDLEYAAVLNNLAVIYLDTGQPDKAASFMRKTIDVKRRIYGPLSPNYLGNLQDLFFALEDVGDVAGTEPYVKEIVEIFREKHDESSPDYPQVLQNLARVYRLTGKQDEADRLYEQAEGLLGRRASGEADIDNDLVAEVKHAYASGD